MVKVEYTIPLTITKFSTILVH